jgi:SAM-dependent methyltransferase
VALVFRLGVKKHAHADDADDWAVDDGFDLDTEVLDYLERNRKAWDMWAPASSVVGHKAWQADELRWGLWNTPESDLSLLRSLEPGADIVELGCGTGPLCAWLKHGGMHPVGVDFSRAQLRTAERFQREFGVSFPLIPSNAEEIPFAEESFDMAISEYGASIWCSPRRWLPEAHRLLRPGGQLLFFTNSAILMACTPTNGGEPGEQLVRDYFANYRVQFAADDAVEFHLTHGEWVRLLRATGFIVEDLIEVRPRPRAQPRYKFVDLQWARRWPSEEIWIARKTERRPPPTEPPAVL